MIPASQMRKQRPRVLRCRARHVYRTSKRQSQDLNPRQGRGSGEPASPGRRRPGEEAPGQGAPSRELERAERTRRGAKPLPVVRVGAT